MMEPEENSKFHSKVVQAAIDFSRVVMRYGDVNSYERINAILTAYDPDLPSEIMMLMLRGDDIYSISIKLENHWTSTQKVTAIKAIRAMVPLGLKESKDITDEADAGKTVQIPGKFSIEQRKRFEVELKGTGYMIA